MIIFICIYIHICMYVYTNVYTSGEKKFLAHENCLHTQHNILHVTVNAISFPFILVIVMYV